MTPIRCAEHQDQLPANSCFAQHAMITRALRKCVGQALACWTLSFIGIGAPICCAAHAEGPHGDATLIAGDKGNSRFFPAAAETLVFPKISIRQKASVRFKVRSLPHVFYPSGFTLEVPNEEYIPLQGAPKGAPWRGCVIRASLIAPDGSVFLRER